MILRRLARPLNSERLASPSRSSDFQPNCCVRNARRQCLTSLEAEALFAIGVPQVLDDLGLGPPLRAALLKLAASLPERYRSRDEKRRKRLHIDYDAQAGAGGSSRATRPGEALAIAHEAVMRGRELRLRQAIIPSPVLGASIERVMEPYGLIVSAGRWYLAGHTQKRIRAIDLEHILDLELGERHFDIPEDFDLEAFWVAERGSWESMSKSFSVRVRVHPGAAFYLSLAGMRLGPLKGATEPKVLELHFSSLTEARNMLLPLGAAAFVLDPEVLRESLADHARAILNAYTIVSSQNHKRA